MTRASVPSAAMLALQGRMKLNPVEVRQRVAALKNAIDRAKSGRARTEQWVFIRDIALISESLMAAGVWRSTQDDRDAIVTPWLHVLIAAGERAQRDDHSPLGEGDGGVLDGLMDWYQSLLTEASIQQLHWARRSAAQLIHDGVEEERAAGNSVAGYSVSTELARLVADIIRERKRQEFPVSAAASTHVRRCPHRTAAALCTDPDRDGAPTVTWCADRLCQTKLSGLGHHAERAAAMRGDARRQYLIAVQSIEGGASARLLRESIDALNA